MNNQTIVFCVVALLLGMLAFHMLKGACGCKVVEGNFHVTAYRDVMAAGDYVNRIGWGNWLGSRISNPGEPVMQVHF